MDSERAENCSVESRSPTPCSVLGVDERNNEKTVRSEDLPQEDIVDGQFVDSLCGKVKSCSVGGVNMINGENTKTSKNSPPEEALYDRVVEKSCKEEIPSVLGVIPSNDASTSNFEDGGPNLEGLSRKEKRKRLKKLRRKQLRKEAAEIKKIEETARSQDAAEQLEMELQEQIEAELLAKEKADHDEEERLYNERERKAQEDFQRRQAELVKKEEEKKVEEECEEWRYVDDDGPAEIIYQGNEIIVKKRRLKVPAEHLGPKLIKESDHLTSNPLPPQSTAFAAHKYTPIPDGDEQTPVFGTEQDKTHCPFHIKTGVCRFGVRCSRVHVYPDQSFTLLMRNMYTGSGLSWEHDEGLEHSDEEVAQQYEEFYEDVHSEFLQYGELVNFKVCRNGSSHLRGNVYVHYKTEAGAQAAYNATNGRFYASKQITCEFVGVTRWRVALCGEFMKGHHRPCSHGTACNFLHCFRNPRGEYDWADWDSPPPRSWSAKMAKLFGYKRDHGEDDGYDHDSRRRHRSSNSSWKRDERRNRNRGDGHSGRDEYEHSSRHRESRRQRSQDYNSNSSSEESASRRQRHRRHRHPSPEDMYERGTRSLKGRGWDGDDSDVAGMEISNLLVYDDNSRKIRRMKEFSRDVDDESEDEAHHGSRRARTKDTVHSDGQERLRRDEARSRRSSRSFSRGTQVHDNLRSSGSERRGRRSSPFTDKENKTVEVVHELEDNVGTKRKDVGERDFKRSSRSRRASSRFGDGYLSENELDKERKSSRSDAKHDRKRSRKHRSPGHRDESEDGKKIEEEDRWGC